MGETRIAFMRLLKFRHFCVVLKSKRRYAVCMFNRTQVLWGSRSGQVMVEYVMVFVALLALVSVMAICLYAVRQQANRTLVLVGSDYP